MVVDPPSFNPRPCFLHRFEPVYVQALVSKGSVERFDEAIVRWLAGPAEFQSRVTSRVGAEVVHHPIDHDTRDRNVKPNRKCDSRDSPVLGKTLPKGQKKRPQRERHEANGENRMGYENRQKDCAHPIVSRKRLVAQRRDLNHVTDQKQDRDAEIYDHEIAVSFALPATNRRKRGHEQGRTQCVQARNCD